MNKPRCDKCSYGRPRCERGRRLHSEMTRKFLDNGMEFTESHRKRYERWIKH